MKTRKQHVHIKKIHGYTVILVPSAIDTVIMRASVGAGFVHESKYTLGLHHVLEHVLVDSSKQCSPECMLYWDKQGCVMNATTENTTVNYFVKGLPDVAEKMVDYITTILIRPKLSDMVLKREKKAVISELNMIMNTPDYKLSNAFNEAFYVPYGLQYSNNVSLQLDNVKSSTTRDLTKIHQTLYSAANMIFVVYGNFSTPMVVRAFNRFLPVTETPVYPSLSCYSYTNSFIHVPHSCSTVMTMIGFPMKRPYEHGSLVEKLLSVLLMNELRTIHKMVYGIQCTISEDHCMPSLLLQFECIEDVYLKLLPLLFRTLHKYTVTPIDNTILNGIKRKTIYLYHTVYDYDAYYATYLHTKRTLLTKSQLIRNINAFTVSMFKSFMQEILQFQHCTLAYQYPKSFPVDWNTFLKIDAKGIPHLLS